MIISLIQKILPTLVLIFGIAYFEARYLIAPLYSSAMTKALLIKKTLAGSLLCASSMASPQSLQQQFGNVMA